MCVVWSSALGEWGKYIFKKGNVSISSQWTLSEFSSGEEYLKKLDKGNEGMSSMLFVGMTYIISLATAGWHAIWQSMLCHLGCLEVTVSYGNKGKNNMRKRVLILVCWESILKPRGQQPFTTEPKLKMALNFHLLIPQCFRIWMRSKFALALLSFLFMLCGQMMTPDILCGTFDALGCSRSFRNIRTSAYARSFVYSFNKYLSSV